MMSMRPIAVDLFAGAGGMTLGFEQAGFDVLAAVEIDPIHCATHEYNFPFWTVLCRSVTKTTGEEIRRLSAIGDRDIDVVFGGPPCQGFSLIGKRSLDDSRNTLVFHFLRLILELKPKFFVMENVKGMTIGKHRQFIQEIIEEFWKSDYKVQENYQVLNAAYYGVPQNRERLFLMGCRKDCDLPNYPQPITKPKYKNSEHCKFSNLPYSPTVRDAIADLPEVNNYSELNRKDWVIADYGEPSDYASKLRYFSDIQEDYSYQRKYAIGLLTSSLRTKHTPETIKRFAQTPPGKTEPISRFYKLSLDGLCNTLRAGTASNRGAFTSPRPIHPFTPRCITVREAARLHSYPDWFRFHATKWHGFRQIGNSVPPLLAKAVASEILKALNINPSKPKHTFVLENEKLLISQMTKAAKYYEVDSHIIEPRKRILKN
jgi:DNA (cytosine-5)-methyltransferase 1